MRRCHLYFRPCRTLPAVAPHRGGAGGVTAFADRSAPGARGRAGFALAPILYMLTLIGVGAGVLFSGYSQILCSNQQMTQNMSVQNDMNGSATTLAASSTLSSDST